MLVSRRGPAWPEQRSLASVDVTQANVRQLGWVNFGHVQKPLGTRNVCRVGAWEFTQESQRHAMHVAGRRRRWCVDVSMSVDPYDGSVGTGAQHACHRAERNAVVTTHDEGKATTLD